MEIKMKKVLLFSVIVTMSTILLNAQSESINKEMDSFDKIQNVFKKQLRKRCQFTSVCLAQKHTQEEWESIHDNDMFKKEFEKLCPKGVGVLDDELINDLFHFSFEYAKGTKKHRDI